MALSARDKADLQKVARVLLDMPVQNRPMKDLNEAHSLDELGKANLDGKARIFLVYLNEAMKGNLKAAEFVYKYAGLEPVKESHVVMDVPQIVDDMGGQKEEVKKVMEEVILYDDPTESKDD